MFNGKIGCISYLIHDRSREILIEGIQYIMRSYYNYDNDKLYDSSLREYYSLEMILKSLKGTGLEREFLKICVFDCLIGNTDRHHSNWGIIQDIKSKSIRLSPLYDNGSSLCCRIREEDISEVLRDKNRFNALVDTKSRSIIRIDKSKKKPPRHLEVLAKLKEYYFKETIVWINSIKDNINDDNLMSILSRYNSIISDDRSILIKEYLKSKAEKMINIYYN